MRRVYHRFNTRMMGSVDYVLVYEHPDYNTDVKEEKKAKLENLRKRFVVGMKKESLDIEEERVGKHVFVKVYCSMDRLCQEAETMRIELPLYGLNIQNPEKKISMLEKRLKKIISGRKKEEIHVIAPFQKKCLDLFTDNNGINGPVFWSALRYIMVYNILINIDISRKTENEGRYSKQGLSYLLMVGAYNDSFILHDPSSMEPVSMHPHKRGQDHIVNSATSPVPPPTPNSDLRRTLSKAWGALCRRQPVHLIRNYFGEKIAFYFAWVGLFISSLWIPAALGFVVFVFGVCRRFADPDAENKKGLLHFVEIIRNSSDNALTPCFATIICLWGTIFFEIWKRRQISLAHEWHVEDFDMVEPDRPQFYGTHSRSDPLSGLVTQHYPFARRLAKYFISIVTLLFMVMLVFISVTSVILYRVYMTVSFCADGDGLCDLLHGTVIATLLNTISIMILGKIYEFIAVKLTDWENHQTLSAYNDALIIKLYAFQFANTYTSLFYTAFFRRDFDGVGIFGLGSNYTDNCGKKENSNCMSLLSFQLLVLMIVKPFPKFVRDVVFPWFKKCCRRFRFNAINDAQTDGGVSKQHFLIREKLKPPAEDFRLSEFTEKMIQYGYLMMFAASFPLAPLLALLFNLFDRRMDAKRLLWWNRRPTPYRDNDIGIWFQIINFINICAVISNAFLIAFNSEFGRDQTLAIKFAIIIGFEHIVFCVKFAISLTIPDTPTSVKNSQRKERFLISYLMSKWKSALQPTETTNGDADSSTRKDPDEIQISIPRPSQSLEFNNPQGTKRDDLPHSRWSYG